MRPLTPTSKYMTATQKEVWGNTDDKKIFQHWW